MNPREHIVNSHSQQPKAESQKPFESLLPPGLLGARDFTWRCGDVTLRRAELLTLAGAVRARLELLPPGSRLMALADTPLELAVFHLAAAASPHTLMLGNPDEPARLLPLLQSTGAVALLTGGRRGIAGGLRDAGVNLPLLALQEGQHVSADGWPESPVSDRATPPGARLNAGLIAFTSGSTGLPKAFGHHWRSVAVNSAELSGRLGLSPEDHFAAMLPIFHLYGFLFNLAMPLALGADLTANPVREFSPGFLSGISATVAAGARLHVMAVAGSDAPPPPRLRRFVSSGGPLAAGDSLRLEQRWGLPVANIYGSSEAMMIAVNDPVAGDAEADLGAPLPSCRWRLAEDGELQVHSEKLSAGYEIEGHFHPLSLTPDGWLRSGDLARAAPRGLQISGRRASTINVGGKKVVAEAVEAALRELPGILDAAACAYPDPAAGERVGALLVAQGAPIAAGALRAALQGRLQPYELPRRVAWVAELPRLANGKLDRQAVPMILEDHLAEKPGD